MQQQIKMASISCLQFIKYHYDWDNDGDIDILSNEVTIAYASQGIVMYENDGTGKRFSTSVVAA